FETRGRMGRLAIDRFIGRLENQLIKREIKPLAEFESRMPDRARVRETESLVKRNAAAIRKVDSPDHDVILLAPCGIDQMLHECETDTFSAVIFVNVDGMLYRVFVGRPGPEDAI